MTRLPIRPRRQLPLLVYLLFSCFVAVASDTLRGEIQFAPAQEGPVWVGQKLELNLELWSTGYSFGDQLFVLPEISGGYLMQADSTTVKLSELRAGVQWQGLSYSLSFYPQRAGRLEVPSFAVQFSSGTGYGSEPTLFDYRTPTLYVEAQLPQGADTGALLVTTESFNMQASWLPQAPNEGPFELKVGDALTLQVEREAQDVPGMVFAPLPEFTQQGLSAYPDAPNVHDQADRGSLTGNRTDSITYIFEREGSYTIPGLRFQWWDPEKEVLAEKNIPDVTVNVSPNPAFADQSVDSGQLDSSLGWKVIAGVLGVLTVLILLFRLAWPYLQKERREETFKWLHATFRSLVRRVIKDANELPPLNPLSPKEH
jgi:hypothetical protein